MKLLLFSILFLSGCTFSDTPMNVNDAAKSAHNFCECNNSKVVKFAAYSWGWEVACENHFEMKTVSYKSTFGECEK